MHRVIQVHIIVHYNDYSSQVGNMSQGYWQAGSLWWEINVMTPLHILRFLLSYSADGNDTYGVPAAYTTSVLSQGPIDLNVGLAEGSSC
jgi:hypothetical protein